MVRAILIFSVAVSTIVVFSPLVVHYLTTHLGFPTSVGHLRLAVLLPGALLLPGAIVGSVSYFRTRLFSELLPATACVLLALIGILWVEPSERERGLIIAASLALALPYAALIVENGYWDLCAKTFLGSAVVVFLLLCLPNSGLVFGLFVIDGFEATNRNGIAMLLSFAVFLLLSLHFRGTLFPNSPKKSMAITSTLLLCFFTGIVLSGSRSGFMLLIFSILSMVFFHVKKHRYPVTACCLACICCYTFLICYIQSAYMESNPYYKAHIDRNQTSVFTRFTSDETIFTLGDRTTIWHSGFSHLLRHPRYVLFGVGTGGAAAAIGKEILILENGLLPTLGRDGTPRFNSTGCDNIPRFFSHALWMEWFMCYGLLGLLSTSFFVVFALSRAMRLDRQDDIYDRRIFFIFLILANITMATTRLPCSLVVSSLFLAAISNQLSFPVAAAQELQANEQGEDKTEKIE